MLYYLTRWPLRVISKLFLPLEIVGLENIPSRGACIFASNHRSYFDPVVLGYTSPRRLSFVAKDSLFENRLFGFYITQLGAYPIRRHQADFRALRETFRRLKAGRTILIFPEGTRRADNPLQEAEPGIGFIVSKVKVPVIPVYLEGTDKVLPPGSKRLHRAPVKITFGKAVAYEPGEPPETIVRKIMTGIYSLAPR